MLKIISASVAGVGLIIIAGAAGDCDGACISQANSMEDMIAYVSVGLALFAGGIVVLIKGE